jgi:hypothetical protein
MFFGMDKILVSAMACFSLEGCNRLTLNSSEDYSTASPFIPSECDMNAYCKSLGGLNSYCKDWQTVSSCFGADEITHCDSCGVSNITTAATTFAPRTTGLSVATTVSPSTSRMSGSSNTARPEVFLWVEQSGSLKSKSDFVDFYRKLNTFILQQNAVNLAFSTLVIRTPHPKYPTSSAEAMYWPPASSPLYTELIAPMMASKKNIKILLYPYIMEDFDRDTWVTFASIGGKPVVGSTGFTVYDGVFAFTKAWQDFVNVGTVTIDGFMIDYEEIYKAMGTSNVVTLTQEVFTPYKKAYPTIKTATTVGFDDAKRIAFFDPFMDYIHLQVYDLYYPYVGADKSAKDSIFESFRDNPTGLHDVILKKVFTSSILNNYKGRENKIKLMWSTQTLATRNCLYPLRDGTCGVNYEFNWSPQKFNEFIKLVQSSYQLGGFEHGIYTYNFMPVNWT